MATLDQMYNTEREIHEQLVKLCATQKCCEEDGIEMPAELEATIAETAFNWFWARVNLRMAGVTPEDDPDLPLNWQGVRQIDYNRTPFTV